MTCLCKGKGYFLNAKGQIERCFCQKAKEVRADLLLRGFDLQYLKPFNKLDMDSQLRLSGIEKEKRLLLTGAEGKKKFDSAKLLTEFYSIMFKRMKTYPDTKIITVDNITSMKIQDDTTDWKQGAMTQNLGIILGGESTKEFHAKAMQSFVTKRMTNPELITIFVYPSPSLRELDKIYGTLFSDMLNTHKLKQIEVS